MASRESPSQRAAAAAAVPRRWRDGNGLQISADDPGKSLFFSMRISLAMEMYGQWKLQKPLGRRFEAGPSLCLRRSRSIGRPLRHERQLLAFVKQKSRDTYRPLLFSFVFFCGKRRRSLNSPADISCEEMRRYEPPAAFFHTRLSSFFNNISTKKRLVEPFQSAEIHLCWLWRRQCLCKPCSKHPNSSTV